jgi:hypothetical protein
MLHSRYLEIGESGSEPIERSLHLRSQGKLGTADAALERRRQWTAVSQSIAKLTDACEKGQQVLRLAGRVDLHSDVDCTDCEARYSAPRAFVIVMLLLFLLGNLLGLPWALMLMIMGAPRG